MWAFFSVAILAAAALVAWRWYLDKQPLSAEFVKRLDEVERTATKAQNAASNLALNRRGA
jgi:predicted negative regulator of RcsB-dependent stress response